jgi:hypothetical protein
VSRCVWARSLISSRDRGKLFHKMKRVRMLYAVPGPLLVDCPAEGATFLTYHVIPRTAAAAPFTDVLHTTLTHGR